MTTRTLPEVAIDAAIEAGKRTLAFYHGEIEVVVKDDNSPLTQADLESNKAILEYLRETDIPVLSEENRIVSYEERIKWKQFWLIDPLDGTKEFIHKRSEYTINIALIRKGVPIFGVVYAPVLNTLYYGSDEHGSFKKVLKGEVPASTIMETAEKLTLRPLPEKIRIVASRSHLSDETRRFISQVEQYHTVGENRSYGSSLKLCMVAEGAADIYPRLGPTMEWDTAASHAVAIYAGSRIVEIQSGRSLQYNKPDLLNPWFVVYHPGLEVTVNKIINKA